MIRRAFAVVAAAVLTTAASVVPMALHAEEGDAAAPSVAAAWARATPGGARTGAAYGEIHGAAAEADKLVAITTPAAGRAEIHTHITEDGVMKMRRLEALDIPAGGTVTFAPGGLHIMLFDLKAPLKAGETFPLTLRFEKGGAVEATATVAPIGAMTPTAEEGATSTSNPHPGSGSGSGSGNDEPAAKGSK